MSSDIIDLEHHTPEIEHTIAWMFAMRGEKATIKVPCRTCKNGKVIVPCGDCKEMSCACCSGTGGCVCACCSLAHACGKCGGSKTIRVCRDGRSGPCSECSDTGEITVDCRECRGRGTKTRRARLHPADRFTRGADA